MKGITNDLLEDVMEEVEVVKKSVTGSRSTGSSSGKSLRKKIIIAGIIIVLIAGAFFYWKTYTSTDAYKQANKEKINKEMIVKVSKLMMAPEEVPTVFEVSNADTLKGNQAFFKDVSNGDYLLVYSIAAKAVIYNPSKNIIVNVGPLSYGQQPQAQNQVPQNSGTPPVTQTPPAPKGNTVPQVTTKPVVKAPVKK